MQYIKLGLKNKIYEANSTWYCLTCSSCSARCPREIEIPAVMEAVRHMAIEENIYPKSKKVKEIRRFHEIFLEMIQKYGRLYELRLMAEFNIRTTNFFKDIGLAPKAILKGKISLTTEKTKNKRAIDKMFKMAKELDKK
jgi:heterodisulfide reductase subunit C